MKTITSLMLLFVASLSWSQTVTNGLTPKKKLTLVLEEDLRFGADEEEEHFLWALSDTKVTPAPDKTMLVVDVGANYIRQFAEDGSFMKEIAGPGQGPGELRRVGNAQFLEDGKLVVHESSQPGIMPRFLLFDKNYQFIREIAGTSFANLPVVATVSPKGNIYAGSVIGFDMNTGKMTNRTGVCKLEDWSFVKEYSSTVQNMDMQAFADPGKMADMLGDMIKGALEGTGTFSFDKDGNLFAALTTKYEITKWNHDHTKELMKISREYKPKLYSDDEIYAVADRFADNFRNAGMGTMIDKAFVDRVVKRAEIKTTKNPIFGLVSMPDGHLLVINDINVVDGTQTADIFDSKGIYVGTVTRPDWCFTSHNNIVQMVFAHGFAYTVETDEDDENRVVRYRYKVGKS